VKGMLLEKNGIVLKENMQPRVSGPGR
jgi:hypothetical protein